VLAAERGAGIRVFRAVVRGVRVTRIAIAVVVHGRLLIHRLGAVPGLKYLPGLLVELAETARPGNLGAERYLAPTAGVLLRVVS
jgi:hypothetical protein